MRLIGITGLKTSGKDTTYKAIAAALPTQNVQRVAFADKLKELSALALGFGGPSHRLLKFMDEAKEKWEIRLSFNNQPFEQFKDITGREYLQNIGQAARKVFEDGFWVDQILPPVPPHSAQTSMSKYIHSMLWERYPYVDVLCVTDVRYPNEADRVHELGGEIWEIVRPGTESDGHSSEIPLTRDKIDLTIYNGFDIPTLYAVVADAISSVCV